ncbi:MAG: mannose-1-phosphate guanylyltransferase/mannose-6-phosphate isomerase [Cohaesibacteraceae bacterium]|nr:mannose-1-phosphate guanylyltransferase/mannose-6-phosphate isomerase [Cohaesibacteraceae bacterium]
MYVIKPSSKVVPVILAGGKGTRLWPASRPDRPKQFIPLKNGISLFEKSLRIIEDDELYAAPIIVVGKQHMQLAQELIHKSGVVPGAIICESKGRDTAAAISLAALAAEDTEDPDKLIAVFPSDHDISNYVYLNELISRASDVARRNDLLFTFGIQPSSPSSSFGYIKKGAPLYAGCGFIISEFVEKPDRETAQKYLASKKYLWNGGMFLFPISTFLREMNIYGPETIRCCKQALNVGIHDGLNVFPEEEIFEQAPKISIDYMLMEKTRHAAVIPFSSDWKDLGTWDAVWQMGPQDANGNTCVGDVGLQDANNNYVHSTGPLTTVVGIDDCIVISTPDAVLVTGKNQSGQLKKMVADLKSRNRQETISHPGEIRPWGNFAPLHNGKTHQVKVITVNAGGQLSLQKHRFRAEHWIVVSGTATVTVGRNTSELKSGEHAHIALGSVHRLENFGDEPVVLIEVQTGTYFGEDDIVRLEDAYLREPEPVCDFERPKIALAGS